MANAAVDWTVDKLLSVVNTLNADAAREGARIHANRTRYMTVLRTLPKVADPAAKARLQAQLTTWIHNQVALENRFNDFSASFSAAKAKLKSFLQSASITPPSYLGAIPLIPAAIILAVTAAVTIMAVIAVQNNLQGKSLDGLQSLVGTAASEHWTADQTKQALDAYTAATAAAASAGGGGGDPLGIGKALEKAGPIAFAIAAIILLPPLLAALPKRGRA